MSEQDYSKKWYVLAAVSISALMGTLDASIVNIALPTLSRVFSVEINSVSLAVTSYLLVITSFLIVAGRLGDIFGRKKVFLLGLSVFTLGSIICAIAGSFSMLVGARVIQAVGGSMIAGNSSAIITDSFPQKERGKALGFIGTVVSIGLTLGPPLGGLIIEYIGWRYIFYINIPVGIIAIIGCYLQIKPSKPQNGRRELDLQGMLLLPLILLSLVLGISYQSGDFYFPAISLLIFVILSFIFYRHEVKTKSPLIDFNLLFEKRFLFSNIAGFISYFSLISVIIIIPFYNENILGVSSSQSGKILLALPLVSMFLAPLAGTISDRIGQRILASAGLIVGALGIFHLTGLDQFSSPGQVAFRLILIGTGFAFFTTPNNSAIMGALPFKQRGLASGMLATVRNLGMAIGVAVCTLLFTLWKNSNIDNGFAEDTAFMSAFNNVLTIAVIALLIGVTFSLLRGRDVKVSSRTEAIKK
ncbi:MAG: MFS transporter [candidate division Zixibacteria bacterium]|nr:MFS transporter [candidate division Zixibacteria bacterium]